MKGENEQAAAHTDGSEAPDFARAHIIFYGVVQGVGFRYSARSLASRLGLDGWVRNLPDGTVEAVVEGRKKVIGDFVQGCRDFSFADVTDVKVSWDEYKGEFRGFEIRK
ncbi:MAG: acylphosphatase [Thermoplasmata archaeon]